MSETRPKATRRRSQRNKTIQIRNSKSENRDKSKIRNGEMTKTPAHRACRKSYAVTGFRTLEHSCFGFVSSFDLRISDFRCACDKRTRKAHKLRRKRVGSFRDFARKKWPAIRRAGHLLALCCAPTLRRAPPCVVGGWRVWGSPPRRGGTVNGATAALAVGVRDRRARRPRPTPPPAAGGLTVPPVAHANPKSEIRNPKCPHAPQKRGGA